ncbi:hypothetical protein BDQ12DRAFT_709331 [Crucibulum laeve]|uniref:DUF302 domain-containing protein n=1 Tax=Crucibulum laeve TaxID=68775 RepID=A0A5C3MQS4_9AGAR|nr:hypothetical protein BDQ12DRAFT_709331 [Crucibulum laeve]
MSKTITPFTAQLVTFETTLPYSEVVARLEAEVNKQGSAQIISQLRGSKSRAEIDHVVKTITGAKDFLYFMEISHDKWLDVYEGVEHPKTTNYLIGNPLVAQTILKHDLHAALNIPPRLLITEKSDHSGTSVMYHLPSSVMVLTDNSGLRAAVEALDVKLDSLISRITATN